MEMKTQEVHKETRQTIPISREPCGGWSADSPSSSIYKVSSSWVRDTGQDDHV